MPEFTLSPVGNPFARRHNFYRKVATIRRHSGNEKGAPALAGLDLTPPSS
jgi:hypothetical protein